MPIYPENQFTNPQVFVGTPPPFVKNPQPPEEYIDGRWFITEDWNKLRINDLLVANLQTPAKDEDQRDKFLIKTWSRGNNFEFNPDIISAAFSGKAAGVGQVQSGSPCLMPVDNINSAINFAYLSKWGKFRNNSLDLAYRYTVSPAPDDECWCFWSTNYYPINPNTGSTLVAFPRGVSTETGSMIEACSYPRQPYAWAKGYPTFWEFTLDPGNYDVYRGNKAPVITPSQGYVQGNGEFNAVSLRFSIKPGSLDDLPKHDSTGGPTQSSPPPWYIYWSFGEITIVLFEGESDLKILVGPNYGIFDVFEKGQRVPINGEATTVSGGEDKFFSISVIPVWNGVLISNSQPGDKNWGQDFYFVEKENQFGIRYEPISYIDELIKSKLDKDYPRFGTNLSKIPEYLEFPLNLNTYVSTGAPFYNGSMILGAVNCGITFQVVPIFFMPWVRAHYLTEGEWDKAVENGFNQGDYWYGNPSSNYKAIPVVYFNDGLWYHQPAASGNERNGVYYVLPKRSQTIWDYAFEFEGYPIQEGFRRPIQIWGVLFFGTKETVDQVKTDEGFLTDVDLPQERIQSVTINHALNGTTGKIKWDRYDPVDGLLYRPNQPVGALKIVAAGGVNTEPGTIFTGIALGNSEQDSPDDNTIEIPIFGRELKITGDQRGIRVLNSPFFDGYDHAVALQYLSDYASIPFVSFADPYRLPTGPILAPHLVPKTGDAIWDVMQQVTRESASLVFFDRFGVLRHYDVGQLSGVSWSYPTAKVEQYSDQPDLTQLMNAFVVGGYVTKKRLSATQITEAFAKGQIPDFNIRLVRYRQTTVPTIPWDKLAFYVIPGLLTEQEFLLAARKIIFGLSRFRATGTVTIPGNANIELLDLFNDLWVVTAINHNIDLKEKTWSTTLSLELYVGVAKDTGGFPEPGGNQTPPSQSTGTKLATVGTTYNSNAGNPDADDPGDEVEMIP